MTFFNMLKSFLLLLIVLQVAPPLIEGIKKQYKSYLEPKAKIGLVSFKGVLSDSSSHIKFLNTLFKDPSIKGILIKMECSGSASGTGQAIASEIKSLKALHAKPVGVIVENICTSGGYYIASTADFIVAPGMSLIGSIGVCMPYFFQVRELMETYKIKTMPLKAGAYKNATDPFVDVTEQDKKMLQGLLDDMYGQFVSDIADNRHLARTQSAQWADGKIFSGKQAQALGLIDTIGSEYDAIKLMKKRALIDGEIEFVSDYTQSSTLFSWLCSSQQTSHIGYTASIMESICTYLESRYAVFMQR